MERINVNQVEKVIDQLANIIIKNEVYFCELDSVAGDGDFGMSVAKGFKQLKTEWEELSRDDIGAFLKDAGMIITEYCGGASGPIWGSAFRGAAKAAKGKDEVTLTEIAEMFESGIAGIQKRGKAQLGDKTLLDALIPAAVSIREGADKSFNIAPTFVNAASSAREGAEKTKSMVAKKGRASYVGERSLDHPDAGAMALGIIFTELVQAAE